MNQSDRTRLVSSDDDDQAGDLEAAMNRRINSPDTTSSTIAEGEPVKYTSQLAALLIITNVTVGAGLLAMPATIQESGIIPSIVIQLIFLLAVIATCITCTELTVKTGVKSYHEVVQAHCHKYVYQLTQVAILTIVFGTTVAFMVIIGDQTDRVFASLYGPTFCHSWYLNRRFVMSITTLLVIKPLCSAKTVDFLKYASSAGVLSLGFIGYVVISEFLKQGHVAKTVNYMPQRFSDMGAVMPVLCLAYQCHLSWVPTAATVRKEEKYITYKTISIAMIVCTIIYIIISVLAVLTFGEAIQKDLTESYPGKDWPVIATIAIVAIKCMVTLPAAFYPARLSMVDILSSASPWFNGLSEHIKRLSVTILTLDAALFLALFVPNIIVAVDILGCVSVMFIFTLPGLCYLNLIKEMRLAKQQLANVDSEEPIYTPYDNFKRAASIFFIWFGMAMTFVVLYKSIQNMSAEQHNTELCPN